MKTFEATITQKGHTISYQVRIQATHLDYAKRLLQMQYSNCYVGFVREVC
jgi:hypothetical protein